MENFFLCYECGATYNTRNNFDEHIYVHQAVSLCYQIYEFEKRGGSAPSVKGNEYQRAISPSTDNNSNSSSSKMQQQQQQQQTRSSAHRKTTFDLSRKNASRKNPSSKRRQTDTSMYSDSSSKTTASKQRKISQTEAKATRTNKIAAQENLTDYTRVGAANIRPEKASPKTEANESRSAGERKNSSAIERLSKPPQIADVTPPAVPAIATSATNQTTMDVQKIVKPEKINDGLTVPAVNPVTTLSQQITVSATAATVTTAATTVSQSGGVIGATSGAATTTTTSGAAAVTPAVLPKCPNCDYRSSQGTDMVEHVVRVHKTSIVCLEKTDFLDGKWSERVKLEPKQSTSEFQQCAYCVRTFPGITDYFLHVIICHKTNLLSPGVSKYHCIVHLAHPGMATQLVHIFMRRPDPKPS